MSQRNVDLINEGARRFEARMWTSYGELLDPDAVMTVLEGWPEQGPFIGKEAVLAQYERLTADWDDARVLGSEVLADPGDWVVVEYLLHVRGAASGIESDFRVVTAIRVKDGRILETHWRWNREDAFRAARLLG